MPRGIVQCFKNKVENGFYLFTLVQWSLNAPKYYIYEVYREGEGWTVYDVHKKREVLNDSPNLVEIERWLTQVVLSK